VKPGQDRTPEELFLDEMVEGYRDGRKLDNPAPSANRSDSYSMVSRSSEATVLSGLSLPE
jgi:hypothetical protein